MPIEITDADGVIVAINVADGIYTKTIDGVLSETRPATPEEASNFGPSLPVGLVVPSVDLPTLADQVTQLNDAVQLLILTTLGT